jgi:lysine N6-hydroxylase
MIYDLIGIGIGPFNLGLSAMLSKVSNFKSIFFDKKEVFSWHENMLLDDSMLQVHYLKDLVTMVDPTSRFSFLSYLAKNKKIYPFFHKKNHAVSRAEFNDYYKWAASEMDNLIFGSCVNKVHFEIDKFVVNTDCGEYFAKNIVIGAGVVPKIPSHLMSLISDTVFHNSNYKERRPAISFNEKRVAVIGGGQSGAEIVYDILSGSQYPSELAWFSKRDNFSELSDSSFSNDFYSPSFSRYFYNLSCKTRKRKNKSLLLTSDGITQELSNKIYSKIYDIRYVRNEKTKISLFPSRKLRNIKEEDKAKIIEIINLDDYTVNEYEFDVVILATGYTTNSSRFLESIFPNIKSLHELEINKDFSINWWNSKNKIFIQNGLKWRFGLADPNLSLASWRNAIIINSILGENYYDTFFDSLMFTNSPLSG